MNAATLAKLRAETQQPRLVTGPAAGDHHHCPQCGRGWFRPTRCGDCDRNTEQRTMVVGDLPRGVAARVEAVDLRQLLDEREALLKVATSVLSALEDHMIVVGPVPFEDAGASLIREWRAALAKAGGQ